MNWPWSVQESCFVRRTRFSVLTRGDDGCESRRDAKDGENEMERMAGRVPHAAVSFYLGDMMGEGHRRQDPFQRNGRQLRDIIP